MKKKDTDDSYAIIGILKLAGLLNAFLSFLEIAESGFIPYEYWTFTRYVTAFGALYSLYFASQDTKPSDLRFGFIFIAVLFNPFFIIELNSFLWMILHIFNLFLLDACFTEDSKSKK